MHKRLHFILRWQSAQEIPSWKVWNHFLERSIQQDFFFPSAFVLMGTHFHLLCRGKPLEKGWWENQGMELCFSEVIHPKYALHTYRYIYQNPLRAKLVLRVEDYPYHSLQSKDLLHGTLRSVLHERSCLLPYHLQNIEAELSWLNGKSCFQLPNTHP